MGIEEYMRFLVGGNEVFWVEEVVWVNMGRRGSWRCGIECFSLDEWEGGLVWNWNRRIINIMLVSLDFIL